MSIRLSRSSRLSAAERELTSLAAASSHDEYAKESVGCLTLMKQVLRGERAINHVANVLQMSLSLNVLIVLTMTAVAITSKSLALLSALVENVIDLFVQGLLWYAGTRTSSKQDYAKFPAGTSRFEPVAVIVAASVMVLVSIVFIQEGSMKLVDGFSNDEPEAPHLTIEALVISGTAITAKMGLIFYSRWVLRSHSSVAVEAIQDDNRNDVVSNSFAVAAYVISSADPELWYVDPAGAILIFLLIMMSWGKMGKEQVMQLVGMCASEDFISEVKELCSQHHSKMALDIVRAYHFGSKYLVELEVVVPAEMTVKDAHDIALQLQFKVEQLEDVERAFVHVDYQSRDYDEHVVSREEDALLMYAGYSGGETPPASSVGSVGSTASHPHLHVDIFSPVVGHSQGQEDSRSGSPVPGLISTPTSGDASTSSFHEMRA